MRILHPTDFSEAAMRAHAVAQALRTALNGQLTLLHAIEPPPQASPYGDYWTPELEALFQRARQDWSAEARKRLAALDPEARLEVEWTKPLPAILKHAQRADLVVMGTHGPETLAERILGSITERVIELAKKPVVAVRAEARVEPLKHLLVSTAFADPSRRALELAHRIAQATGARLTLLYVVEPVADPPVPIHMPEPRAPRRDEAHTQLLARQLEALARPFGARPMLREGPPAKTLLEVAAEEAADLILVGKSRQSRFLGSVTREVLEQAPVPLLVHP